MNRVFIDVTATAGTLHHTGIQRIVRTLVLLGAVRVEDWSPVVWGGDGFRAPTRMEKRRLTDVFSRGLHRWPWLSDWWDRMEGMTEFDPLQEGEESLFLIPEIPSGDRLAFLDDLAATGARQMPMVGVCHDLLSWSHPEWTPDSRREGFVDYLRFLALLERVICPSATTAGEWMRFLSETGVKGPVPEVRAWPPSGPIGAERRPESVLPSVLCVGTLEARKNHRTLLDAAQLLWEKKCFFELRLVGRRRARGENEVPDRIAELRERGFPVEWLPRVSDRELEILYQEAAFTVFPSLAEGYGLPVVESLVRGKPCICSPDSAMGEIASGGGCLTTDVRSAEKLAFAIRQLVEDSDQRKALSREGLARKWPTWSEWMDSLDLPLEPR